MTLGFIASGLYAGYLAALFAVGLFAARVGPRLPVMIGLLSAGVGMALVALSSSAMILAAGVILVGTSAGWSWAPYNDAVEQVVSPHSRNRILSIISTGTTFGIMTAGLTALAAAVWDTPWRAAWFVFALSAFATAAYNAWILPSGSYGSDGGIEMRRLGWSWLVRAGSVPLFVVALSFGVVNAIYWSFAVDLISSDGVLAAGPVLYATLGVFGFAGLFTGDAVARFGLRRVLVAIQTSLGVSVGILGRAPASGLAVSVPAILFGVGVMAMSALLSVWSSAAFPEQPSTGFSVTLFLFAIGNVAGPAAAAVFADEFGLGAVFLLTGVLALLTTLVLPTGELRSAATKSPSEGSSDRAFP